MNFYDALEIESIQLGTPLVQQPNILQLLGNPQVGTDSTAISSELLYQLLRLAKIAIQQENPTLADKINGVKLEYERFVAITDDEAQYRTEHHFVTDSDWSKKQRSANNESELPLSKDEKTYIEKLAAWISVGINEIFPQFEQCLGTQIQLSVELKPSSSNPPRKPNLHSRELIDTSLLSRTEGGSSIGPVIEIPITFDAKRCSCRGERGQHLDGDNCKSGCR